MTRWALQAAGAFVLALCVAVQATLDRVEGPEDLYVIGVFIRPSEERLARLLEAAHSVSDPQNVEYGRYMDQEQLIQAIGVPKEVAESAEKWSRDALTRGLKHASAGAKDFNLNTVQHRDAVVISSRSFVATYMLGKALDGVHADDVKHAPPKEVELIVTPPMPDDFCRNVTSVHGKHICPEPCYWHQTKSKSSGNTTSKCRGRSGGWQCWLNSTEAGGPRWRCFDQDPSNSSSSSSSRSGARRPKRTGHVWSSSGRFDTPDPELTERTAAKVATVWPISNGFIVSVNETLLENASSVTLSFRHAGEKRSYVVDKGMCGKAAKEDVCTFQVANLKNLHPADDISLCFNNQASHIDYSEDPCRCNETAGLDHNGRNCSRLRTRYPTQDPADLVLPVAPYAVHHTRRDMGIPNDFSLPLPSLLSPRNQVGASKTRQIEQAVGEFNLEGFSMKDLRAHHQAFGMDPSRLKVHILGPRAKGNVSIDDALEGSLDMQFMTTVAPDASTAWIGIHPNYVDGFMLAYAMKLNDEVSPARVHSISWSADEAAFVPAFLERLDYEFMKLVLRGITLLVSSGDGGINGLEAKCSFTANVAALSPWATAVGATMPSVASRPFCSNPSFLAEYGDLYPNCEEPGQVVCSAGTGAIITSSGGWSTQRKLPLYQAAAVEGYLGFVPDVPTAEPFGTGGPTNATATCSFTGRKCAVKDLLRKTRVAADISAPGHNFAVMVNKSFVRVDGTSASAPIVAALVALLNAQQEHLGQPPLGLLNPWLYQVHARDPSAFEDVMVGNNSATMKKRCSWGFVAAPGWDPPTGLGVPQFKRLLHHLPSMGFIAETEASHEEAQSAPVDLLASQRSSPLLAGMVIALASSVAAAAVIVGVCMSTVRQRHLPWRAASSIRQPVAERYWKMPGC